MELSLLQPFHKIVGTPGNRRIPCGVGWLPLSRPRFLSFGSKTHRNATIPRIRTSEEAQPDVVLLKKWGDTSTRFNSLPRTTSMDPASTVMAGLQAFAVLESCIKLVAFICVQPVSLITAVPQVWERFGGQMQGLSTSGQTNKRTDING
jgi:hypothetical protein